MADTKKVNKSAYDKVEQLVYERVFSLEDENARLRNDLAIAQAKLDVYEQIATVSGAKTSLGFGPPIIKE